MRINQEWRASVGGAEGGSLGLEGRGEIRAVSLSRPCSWGSLGYRNTRKRFLGLAWYDGRTDQIE